MKSGANTLTEKQMTDNIFPLYILAHAAPPHDEISVCRIGTIDDLERLAESFKLECLGLYTSWHRRRLAGYVAGFDQTPTGYRAAAAICVIGKGVETLLAIRADLAATALADADLWAYPNGSEGRSEFEAAARKHEDLPLPPLCG